MKSVMKVMNKRALMNTRALATRLKSLSGAVVVSLVVAAVAHPAKSAKTVNIQKPKASPKATVDLFATGKEIFRLQDRTGSTPAFKILHATPAKRALGLAIATTLNSSGQLQSPIPAEKPIELRLERITFAPMAGHSDQLAVTIRVSGNDVALGEAVSRTRLLSGQQISLNLPQSEQDVSLFSVRSNGRLKMSLDTRARELLIDEARAQIHFESPLAGSDSESIYFSGKGIRL
jgi:hypothetical protein